MKRKNLIVPALILCLAFLVGCAVNGKSASVKTADSYVYESYDMPGAGVNYAMEEPALYARNDSASLSGADTVSFSSASSRTDSETGSAYAQKIIYTAYLTLRTDNPVQTVSDAAARCAELGGYLAASNQSTSSSGVGSATATLKIPANLLNQFFEELKGAGKVEKARMESDDISSSYYDIAARLEAAKAEEAQLLVLMEQCKTVEEVLLVRSELASVRSDIESYQSTIRLWDNRTAYATVELTVRETEKPVVADDTTEIELWKISDVWRNIKSGFNNSWRFLLNALAAIGIFLASVLLPAAVLGVLLYFVIRLIVKLIRKNRSRKAERKTGKKEKQSGDPKDDTAAEK